MGSHLKLAKSWLPVDSSENMMSGFFLDSENILGCYLAVYKIPGSHFLVHVKFSDSLLLSLLSCYWPWRWTDKVETVIFVICLNWLFSVCNQDHPQLFLWWEDSFCWLGEKCSLMCRITLHCRALKISSAAFRKCVCLCLCSSSFLRSPGCFHFSPTFI